MHQFDPNIPNLIAGEVTRVAVVDPAATFPGFEVGNHVLNRNNSFQVRVEWEITGSLRPLWLAALGGSWVVQVYAESIGGGPETRLARDVSVAANPNVSNYAVTLTVPPNTLPESDPDTSPAGDPSGIYKLVASVFLNSNLPGAGFDMIGFNEGPIIQVENPR